MQRLLISLRRPRSVARTLVGVAVFSTLEMLTFASAGSVRAANESVQVWLTTTSGSSLATKLAQQGNVTFGAQTGTTPAIDVNSGTSYQTIDGFGGAMTDSAAWLIYNSPQRTAIMNDLFSTSGAHFNFVRLPMGASDIARNNYSYDDMPAGQTDTSLAQFSVSHDTPYIIPIDQQARSLNSSLKLDATPWSAPGWMKFGGTFVGNCSGNNNYLNNAYYGAYASYFAKFVQAYQSTYNLPIYMVSMQNEPHNCNSTYATMNMEPSDQGTFAGNLRTALSGVGASGTKILGWDHNWYENGSPTTYPQSLMAANSGAVDAIGYHCYSSPDGTYTVQTTLHNAYPSKDVYFTECTGGAWATNQAANLVWETLNNVIGPVRNWARASTYWSMALDQNSGPYTGGCTNCRGMVTVNNSNGTYTKNEDYYVWAHFAKFVDANAVRVDSTDLTSSGLPNVAFRNPDGSIVEVVLNSGSGSSTFQTRWNGQGFNYTLPASSLATFKWTAGTGTADTTAPSVPTGLTSPSHTDTTVALSWTASTDNVGVTGYQVLRNGTQVGTTTSTSYTDTGLTASTGYSYTVKAYDAAGNVSAASSAMSVTTSAASTISSTAWYEVINQNSSKCVDDAGSGTGNGTVVQQSTCGASPQNNQEWQFQPTDSGYYKALNRNASAQSEVWDVSGGSGATGNGVKIQTWAYGGGTNQQWQPVSLGGGYYKFVARNSGTECLDVTNVSTADGVQLQQWTCNGGVAQSFRLTQEP